MSVAYIHHSYYFAPIRLIVYLVIIAIVAVIGAFARRSRARNMSQYGRPPTPGGWQQAPPPGSPYAAWGNNQQGNGQQPPQQGSPQQPYAGQQPPQPGWGQPPSPPGYGQQQPPPQQPPPW